MTIQKATPVQIRKALEVVDAFKKAGIRFVQVPVIGDEDEAKTVELMQRKLDIIEEECAK